MAPENYRLPATLLLRRKTAALIWFEQAELEGSRKFLVAEFPREQGNFILLMAAQVVKGCCSFLTRDGDATIAQLLVCCWVFVCVCYCSIALC